MEPTQRSPRVIPHFSSVPIMLLLALASLLAGSARAQTYTVLHSFGQGTDGANPLGGLNPADNGDLLEGFWGSTQNAGTSGDGTLFQLTSSSGVWTETVVHNFTGLDGMNPASAPSGTYRLAYGTAEFGGNVLGDGASGGTAYEIHYTDSEWQFTTLYRFCALSGCADGALPFAGTLGLANPVYGTTITGGAKGQGTIFEIDPSTGAETVLHSFAGGADGAEPYAGFSQPLYPLNGNPNVWYGTTFEGGPGDVGTVFSFNSSTDAVATIHSFTGSPDGAFPVSGLSQGGPPPPRSTRCGASRAVVGPTGTAPCLASTPRRALRQCCTASPAGRMVRRPREPWLWMIRGTFTELQPPGAPGMEPCLSSHPAGHSPCFTPSALSPAARMVRCLRGVWLATRPLASTARRRAAVHTERALRSSWFPSLWLEIERAWHLATPFALPDRRSTSCSSSAQRRVALPGAERRTCVPLPLRRKQTRWRSAPRILRQ